MKILLGDFNAKVGREIIFKPTIGQESLHQDSNDNGVRLVNFATSKNLVVKSTMFPPSLAQDRHVADACECGNEPSGSVKCGEFLDYLHTS